MGLDRAEGGNSNWHHREWHTLLVQIVEGNNIVMGNGGMQQVLGSRNYEAKMGKEIWYSKTQFFLCATL